MLYDTHRHRLAPAALALLALLTSNGCATQEEFDRRAAYWVGRSEGELVTALGVPAATYETRDGRRFLQYETRRLLPGDPYLGGFYYPPAGRFVRYGFGWGYGYGYGGLPPVELACDLTFELQGARVTSFSRRGNDCVAVPQTS